MDILRYVKFLTIGALTGMANGLFGSGGGTIAVPAMILILGMEDHKAHATAISIILPLTIISGLIYISNGYYNLDITWKVTLGGMAGGYIGARLLSKCPTSVLGKIFAVFIAIAAVRMLMN